MPAAHPVEFRRRAVVLARAKEKPIAQLAADLSESCLRRWMKIADVDEGVQEGVASDERAELVRLRRENRVQAAEIEILRQASGYFAREVVEQKGLPGDRPSRRHRDRHGFGVPGAAGLAIGLLRLEEPPDLGEVSG